MLEFYAIESPLAQPRNAIVGQAIATVAGVAVAKLFQLSSRFDDLRWVGGALACASATALMGLTKTVHPPAGATALLAVVDNNLVAVGWLLVPVMLLGCALMLAIALLVNNLERRFPMYWWTPLDLPHKDPAFVSDAKGEAPKPQHQQRWRLRRRAGDDEEAGVVDEEKTVVGGSSSQQTGESDGDGDGATAPKQGQRTVAHGRHAQAQVVIRRGQVIVPEHLILTQDEVQLLESMSHRIS